MLLNAWNLYNDHNINYRSIILKFFTIKHHHPISIEKKISNRELTYPVFVASFLLLMTDSAFLKDDANANDDGVREPIGSLLRTSILLFIDCVSLTPASFLFTKRKQNKRTITTFDRYNFFFQHIDNIFLVRTMQAHNRIRSWNLSNLDLNWMECTSFQEVLDTQ